MLFGVSYPYYYYYYCSVTHSLWLSGGPVYAPRIRRVEATLPVCALLAHLGARYYRLCQLPPPFEKTFT